MEHDIFEEISRTVNNNTGQAINNAMFGTGLVFGTIASTGLALDDFKHIITDYMVLDYLTLKDSYYTEVETCTVGHKHEFKTPIPIKKLKVGERVLVAQVSGECVVVGRISHGESIS